MHAAAAASVLSASSGYFRNLQQSVPCIAAAGGCDGRYYDLSSNGQQQLLAFDAFESHKRDLA
jgi:hypothetical protein